MNNKIIFLGVIFIFQISFASFTDSTRIGNGVGGFVGTIGYNDGFRPLVSSVDVDQDGVNDLIGYRIGSNIVGHVWIIGLNSDGTVKWQKDILPNEAPLNLNLPSYSMFGIEICTLRDFDGDGIEEFLVLASGNGAHVTTVRSWVISLNSLGEVKTFTEGPTNLGTKCKQYGDDGLNTYVAFGHKKWVNTFRYYKVDSSANFTFLGEILPPDDPEGEGFPSDFSLIGFPRTPGQKSPTILVGDSEYNDVSRDMGRIYGFHTKDGITIESSNYSLNKSNNPRLFHGGASNLGRSIVSMGDLNSDGNPDWAMIVGNPAYPQKLQFALGESGSIPAQVDSYYFPSEETLLNVLNLGDINSDGMVDVAVTKQLDGVRWIDIYQTDYNFSPKPLLVSNSKSLTLYHDRDTIKTELCGNYNAEEMLFLISKGEDAAFNATLLGDTLILTKKPGVSGGSILRYSTYSYAGHIGSGFVEVEVLPHFAFPNQVDLYSDIDEDMLSISTLIDFPDTTQSGDDISYWIDMESKSYGFVIDSLNGELLSTYPIDAEVHDTLHVTIYARSLTQYDTSLVHVAIRQINDKHTIRDTSFSISESANIGDTIGYVTVEDNDGPKGSLTYSISNHSSLFSIDPQSGVIQVSGKPDYELDSTFNPTIRVSDQDYGISRSIEIKITDINEPPLLAGYTINVFDSISIGTVIDSIVGVDPEGDTGVYKISRGDPNSLFYLDSISGELTIANGVVFENYTITVEMIVGGDTATANYRIIIENTNESFPIINDDTLFIIENAAIGISIGEIFAHDPDSSIVNYALVDSLGKTLFTIDSISGELFVKGDLDYELSKYLDVQVAAISKGDTAFANLKIIIADENDNLPVLDDATMTLSSPFSIGDSVYTFVAFDPDEDLITYSILDGNEKNFLKIDSLTGVVTIFNSDGISGSYNLTIEALAGGDKALANLQIHIPNNTSVIRLDLFLNDIQLHQKGERLTVIGEGIIEVLTFQGKVISKNILYGGKIDLKIPYGLSLIRVCSQSKCNQMFVNSFNN